MKVLRTAEQVALNDLLIAYQKSSDHLLEAHKLSEDPSHKRVFLELSELRNQATDRIRDSIIQLGNMPSTPDSDSETVELLVDRLSVLFSTDKDLDLIEQRQQTEDQLLALVSEHRTSELSENFSELLENLAENSHRIKQKLDALKNQ